MIQNKFSFQSHTLSEMIKKFSSSFIIACFCISLSACGISQPEEPSDTPISATAENTPAPSDNANVDQSLTVYYLGSDSASMQILSGFSLLYKDIELTLKSFSSIEQMDTVIAAEQATEADVILFPNTTSLDVTKTAFSGNFTDMNPYLTADETFQPENYYTVLDAGTAGGEQIYMPLRFKCRYFLTTKEKQEAGGPKLSESYTVSDLFHAFETSAASIGDDKCTFVNEGSFISEDYLYDTLRLTGIELLDLDKEEILISDELAKEYAGYAKLIYQELEKAYVIIAPYKRDFAGALSRSSALITDSHLPINLRYYDSLFRTVLEEQVSLLTYPNYDNPDGLTADITLYAAISQNSEQKDAAYRLVRYAMDSPMGQTSEGLSINRQLIADLLEELCTYGGKYVNTGSMNVQVTQMNPEMRAVCENALDRIEKGSIRNNVIGSVFEETMSDYIKNEVSFEECYSEFKNKMELYLYE